MAFLLWLKEVVLIAEIRIDTKDGNIDAQGDTSRDEASCILRLVDVKSQLADTSMLQTPLKYSSHTVQNNWTPCVISIVVSLLVEGTHEPGKTFVKNNCLIWLIVKWPSNN